ncbi:EAL domain-containing protein [Cognatiyoonia sp. IB215446]|uniref:sensor domain-containing protein n=1 Tax=Cognatiyoonia sp. IB215446 TaxID=3097355 RepID=UPI002A138983|nr:EAL domain-containing protein [Cognatiyoonia sp. IB215446]MDX8347239.1 EAL domain-containing protein [Cognatiyoonia sp. IB215446]
MLSLLTQPVAVIDCYGVVVDCNAAFRDCADLPEPNGHGAPLAELMTPDTWSDCLDYLRQCPGVGTGDDVAPFVTTLRIAGQVLEMSLAPMRPDDRSAGFLCQLERTTRQEDARLAYLMEHLDQGVWDYDVPTETLTVSKKWREIRGLGDDVDLNAPGRRWKDNTHAVDRITLQNIFDEQVRGERRSISVRYRYRHMQGHWIWVLCRAKVVENDKNGRPLRIVGTDTDVTILRQRDSDMQQLTNKLQLAIDASGIGVWEYDRAKDEVHWDDRMLEIYGITDGQNMRRGDMWETYLHPDDLEDARAYSAHCQKHGLDFRRDFRIVRPNGDVRHIRSLAGFVARDANQAKLIGVNIDVTEDYERSAQLEAARAQLEFDSRHDALTGVANRRLLDECIGQLRAHATPTCRGAVLHLDLDFFKQINDTLGHPAGDAVLVHVARTLKHLLGDQGLVCRTGGDEFVVLFSKAPDSERMHALCKAIVTAFEQPFYFDGHHCAFGVSVGCAFSIGKDIGCSDMFAQADAALYAAKQAGRGRYHFYSGDTRPTVAPDGQTRQDLLDALMRGEILCYFQPQYDANTNELAGAEALVRWNCPHRGLLKPDAFMPEATKLGVADRIDAHVFEQVVSLQSEWRAKGLPFPLIAMNVSPDRLNNALMLDHVRSLIKPHHKIAFELLETAFLDEMTPDQIRRLTDLRALGVGIDLDDFGSGHSSVAAMQAIGPDRIKIDQSLVGPIVARPEQIKTLQLLSQMARLEKLQIVVEGLDAAGHLNAIADVDCDLLQGFALSKPLPVAEFEALLHPLS